MLEYRGQPAVQLVLPDGANCVVALHGAQLLSWTTADGIERLYLSPDAVFDGHAAIRGGVPICWPQFNQRGPLQKHGFARNVSWQVAYEAPEGSSPSAKEGETQRVVLSLYDSEATRVIWPYKFSLHLAVILAPEQVRIELDVSNTDSMPWTFAAALHTYLRVDDIAQVQLAGLFGAKRWDAVRDERHVEKAESLHFDSEFDSVYATRAQPLQLMQPSGTVEISQSPGCTETIVWNPGAALSAKLADMPDDGYRHMLCVEAACVDDNITLAPGAQWQAWQQLSVS